MKKSLSLLLAIGTVMAVVGCGSSEEPELGTPSTEAAVNQGGDVANGTEQGGASGAGAAPMNGGSLPPPPK